jgi:carbohydrate kinase (thermoresistant glucokinase family)
VSDATRVLVVMGVAGVGKSTLAAALAERLGWPFQEGDALHPAANIAKMTAGEPLTDTDRLPWLDAIGAWIDGQLRRERSGVITCSALKRAYRERLAMGRPGVTFVFIQLGRGRVAERMAARKGHFMPPSLLDSQFADLEPPGPDEPVIVVDGAAPISAQVEAVVRRLAPSTPSGSSSPDGEEISLAPPSPHP